MLWEPIHDDISCECSRVSMAEYNRCCERCNRVVNKENVHQGLGNTPTKHESDLSLYGNASPARVIEDAFSPTHFNRRRPLGDHDSNSQDSGYEAGSVCDGNKFFRLARSLGVTPRSEYSFKRNSSLSFCSIDSIEDEFLEFTEIQENKPSGLPSDFSSLISGTFPTEESENISPEFRLSIRPLLKRSISLNVDCQTPNSSKVRSCLFKEENEIRPFKRPEPPTEFQSPIQTKRSKVENKREDAAVPECLPSTSRPLLRRSVSATDETIMHALQRSSTQPDLIGDFSTIFCLPLIHGRHQDLKSISPSTLAALMKGEFNDRVACFKVIDCRYPYEFEGGHVNGAENLYTKEQILDELLNVHISPPISPDPKKRHILVFHCEFSSERGPNLYRFLRNLDRIRNKDVYPALYYPELYLLDGGYKNFYEQHSELCYPMAYKPMLHPEHQNDLRHFRAKFKTSDRSKSSSKGFKRLGFA